MRLRRPISILAPVSMLAALMVVQCSKDATGPVQTEPPPVADFPNATGYQWVYQVTWATGYTGGSLNVTIDTLRVVVLDTVRLDSVDALAMEWRHRRGGDTVGYPRFVTLVDPGTATIGYDSVYQYQWQTSVKALEMWVVPLNSGRSWLCDQCFDAVTEWQTLPLIDTTTPAGHFAEVTPVMWEKSAPGVPPGFERKTEWFASQVGLVASTYHKQWKYGSSGSYNVLKEDWLLLSYDFGAR